MSIFGKLSNDHTNALHSIFHRFFGLNQSKTNLKWPNFKILEKNKNSTFHFIFRVKKS